MGKSGQRKKKKRDLSIIKHEMGKLAKSFDFGEYKGVSIGNIPSAYLENIIIKFKSGKNYDLAMWELIRRRTYLPSNKKSGQS